MSLDPARSREVLSRWRRAWPGDYWESNPNLRRGLAARIGPAKVAALAESLSAFGAVVAGQIDPRVAQLESRPELPRIRQHDGLGHDLQEVEFDAAHHEIGRLVQKSGILAIPPGGAFQQAALVYLLGHAGEGGQTCPAACTAGLIRALRRHGSVELQERFLPPLLELDYDRAHRGAQFITEIQGGSDVGANATRAEPDAKIPGAYRISGEKWFCSVADADQFALTARVPGGAEGTAGLGCFLVPRRLENGSLNGFCLRRLKPKLGTRLLPTGEIEFDRALAWPIGALDQGFAIAVGVILNTSRWFNALGSTALMSRAYLIASSFARHREAFGGPIAAFASTREHLAIIKAEEQAALASTLDLTALVDGIDCGTASEEERDDYRFLVNANKHWTALRATDAVHHAIEVLGGNGTIEDFSPLPRLYRDAIIYESWEGPHDVLCAQVYRDFERMGTMAPLLARWRARLAGVPQGESNKAIAEIIDELEPRLRRALEEPAFGALQFRGQLAIAMRSVQLISLLAEAAFLDESEPEAAAEKRAVVDFLIHRWPIPGADSEIEGASERIDAVLAGDV